MFVSYAFYSYISTRFIIYDLLLYSDNLKRFVM